MGICRYCALVPAACGRELTGLSFSSVSLSLSRLSLLVPWSISARWPLVRCFYRSFLVRSTGGRGVVQRARSSPSDTLAGDTQDDTQHTGPGDRTMCHLPCHPIFRSYRDMLKARSTLTLNISFMGVRVCPTSIYRRAGCKPYTVVQPTP